VRASGTLRSLRFTDKNLPVGLQFMARAGDDIAVIKPRASFNNTPIGIAGTPKLRDLQNCMSPGIAWQSYVIPSACGGAIRDARYVERHVFYWRANSRKILRPVIVYIFLIVGLRLSGKRELAQLNPF